jgi:predicted DNA repair protein MutK
VATGLIALLDDVASIAKVAAASIDDVAGQAAKAGAKSAGVVIDDTAVTPRYVVGFTADREIPIVVKIAVGSLKNKLLILLPAAILLSLLAPWAITPLLMAGGLYLCYEGAEKVFEALFPHEAHAHEAHVLPQPRDPRALENVKVEGAIRTDFILSAEIMAIALAAVPDAPLATQAIVLALVGFGITLGVYGVVALIVKADDIGVRLAASEGGSAFHRATRSFGRGLVAFMPGFLKALAGVGTAAMVWVGGGILVHGLEVFGVNEPGHTFHAWAAAAAHVMPAAEGAVEWIVGAAAAGLFGLALGGLTIPLVGRIVAPLWGMLRGRRAD